MSTDRLVELFLQPVALGIFWHFLVGVVSFSFLLSNAFCHMLLCVLGELLRAPHHPIKSFLFFLLSLSLDCADLQLIYSSYSMP